MNAEETAYRQIRFQRPAPGLLGRVTAFVLSALFLLLAFLFSLAALAVVAVAAAAFGGWLWWKTRTIRKAMRGQRNASRPPADDFIDGEAVRTDAPTPRLPREAP